MDQKSLTIDAIVNCLIDILNVQYNGDLRKFDLTTIQVYTSNESLFVRSNKYLALISIEYLQLSNDRNEDKIELNICLNIRPTIERNV